MLVWFELNDLNNTDCEIKHITTDKFKIHYIKLEFECEILPWIFDKYGY